jgi:hypothetical protein
MIFDSFDWIQHEKFDFYDLDHYPVYKTDPYYDQQLYIHNLLEKNNSKLNILTNLEVKLWINASKTKDEFLQDDNFFILQTIYACYTRICWFMRLGATEKNSLVRTMCDISEALLSEISFLPDIDLSGLAEIYLKREFTRSPKNFNQLTYLFSLLEPPSPKLVRLIEEISNSESTINKYKEWISSMEEIFRFFNIQHGDVWSDCLASDLKNLNAESKKSWQNLILHTATADKSQPSSKWDKKSKELIIEIGEESFVNFCLKWFPMVDIPRDLGILKNFYEVPWYISPENASLYLRQRNCIVLKGLVWCCSTLTDNRLIPALGALAESCYKKIPQIGARSQSVGNACIYALSMIPMQEAVTQLERLQTKIKYSQAKRLIQKAFETAAARQGITKEDLLELSVPKYGLNENGTFQQSFGAFTAEVTIQSSTQVTLQWYKPDGKLQKTLPSEVKNNHASELKELKRNISEIESLLKVHRDRIENTYLQPRTWKYTDWQERLATHPLLGYLVNRLVWEFSNDKHQETGIWYQNQVVNTQGQPLTWLATEEAIVRLWHPIFADVSMVSSWRDWLETHQIRQPFKQAYREIYLLTEAEQNTRTYSNRFAAHILRQHQMTQLMKQRGWEYNLQGGFDGANNAIFHLPQGNLSAEFYVEPAGEELSPAYIYLYVASDRVCFYRDRQTQIPLAEIPALAFSEVMRNVDLFVGVASIGNDPNWSDRGENAYNTYWGDYCFGELAMSAQLRREVITRLLPKLKIRDRCKIDDRFLIVEGKKRTYKIHFGSGNILMEPNNSYLCIVADSLKTSQGSEVFLPFEGDGMLSIILSKAFLLAEDDKIKDRSIISQIER